MDRSLPVRLQEFFERTQEVQVSILLMFHYVTSSSGFLRFYEQSTMWRGWWFVLAILGLMMVFSPLFVESKIMTPGTMMAMWLLTNKLGNKITGINDALLRLDRGGIALDGVVR